MTRRPGLGGTTPALALREVVLAALPALLTVGLLTLATRPAYQTLIRDDAGLAPYAYRGLVQDVQQALIDRLTPGAGTAAGARLDIALSSARNPAQFADLPEVERLGAARLSQVALYLQEDTPGALRRAALEAIRLGAQADQHAKAIAARYVAAVTDLRRALLVTALITGVLSMLLTLRALLLWRAERHRRARREARQREALRLASHELRRPLQSLMLASDLLRGADTPERRAHLLALIEDSAAQLASRADLTRLNDLYLDITLRVAPTDLRAVLLPLGGPRVAVSLPEAPLVWTVDQGRLRQLAENLVENALKYTAGPVEVTLRAGAGGAPEIEVRDHGRGLSSDQLGDVFLPLERGPQGLVQSQGLGLPLARRYARAHGGELTLSHAPDGGLVATVRLGEPNPALSEPRRGWGGAAE